MRGIPYPNAECDLERLLKWHNERGLYTNPKKCPCCGKKQM